MKTSAESFTFNFFDVALLSVRQAGNENKRAEVTNFNSLLKTKIAASDVFDYECFDKFSISRLWNRDLKLQCLVAVKFNSKVYFLAGCSIKPWLIDPTVQKWGISDPLRKRMQL